VIKKTSLTILYSLALLIGTGVPMLHAQDTITIDGSGSSGQDGRDGQSYSSAPGASGGRGAHGGDASSSTPGGHGASIDLYLQQRLPSEPLSAEIRIYGEVQSQGAFDQFRPLNSRTQIVVRSNGGQGGRGGRGGDGQGGCNGTAGRDATRSSPGTNGGPGCRGGDAGRGTPGSRGGDGGQVRIHIPVDQIHLGLTVSCSAQGGRGGAAGQHGTPGSGGRGGRGGSSHSWTETVPDGQDCQLVDNGNGSYTNRCTPRTRTVHHSQSGGSTGPSGTSGSSAMGDVSGGRNGQDGRCLFIGTEAGRQTYSGTSLFQVVVESYDLVDDNGDGIIEPLESVRVENIRLKNVGGLPSPSQSADFQVFLPNTRYTLSSQQRLLVPRLEPGQSVTLAQGLEFDVRDNHQMGQGRPMVIEDRLSPQNYVTQVDRAQPGFELNRSFVITYPIEISAFSMARSVGPGEEIPVMWKIKNISSRSYGLDSELERAIRTALQRVGGSAEADHFQFFDSSGRQNLVSQTYTQDIINLPAGEEIVIEGRLQISEQALAYTDIQMATVLHLENQQGEMRSIQANELGLRISQLYRYNPQSEYLLITNHNTQRQEFLAWGQLFRRMGVSFDVWDLSYYGHLSLRQGLEQTGGQALFDLLENKTLILLNNSSDSQRVSMGELAGLLSQRQANFLVLGGERAQLGRQYVEIMQEASGLFEAEQETLSTRFSRLMFWSSPNVGHLEQEVHNLAQQRLAQSPRTRFYMHYRFAPELSESGLFRQTYNLGNVVYAQTLTPGGGRYVALPLSPQELSEPNTINSEELIRAVLLPSSFEFKLERLLNNNEHSIQRFIADSLLYDLFLEMDLDDIYCKYSSCDSESVLQRLSLFLSELSRQTQLVGEAEHIVAAVRLYAEELPRSLRRQVQALTADLAREKIFADKESELRSLARDRRRLLTGISRRQNYRNFFTYPAVHRALTTDSLLRDGDYFGGSR
jgi:hypothetical protein